MNREEIEKKLAESEYFGGDKWGHLSTEILREIACQLAEMNEKHTELVRILTSPVKTKQVGGARIPLWRRIKAEWTEALKSLENHVKRSLPAIVERVSYTVGEDHGGGQSLFMAVVLKDSVETVNLLRAAGEVEHCVNEWLTPVNYENLNLYFNYQKRSEANE